MKPSERCIEPNVFVRGELIRSATINVTALGGVLDEFGARVAALESKDQPIAESHGLDPERVLWLISLANDVIPKEYTMLREDIECMLRTLRQADWRRKLEESAAAVKGGPSWQRAGIDLNPEKYETYPPEPCPHCHGMKTEPYSDPSAPGDEKPCRECVKRREFWVIVSNSEHGISEAYYSQRPEWPGMAAMGWTEHHLVELRDGEQIVNPGGKP